MKRAPSKKRDPLSDIGSSLVETALVTMVLLLFLAGIADVGRAYVTYIALTNASQEGARYAIRHPNHIQGIREAVKAELASDRIHLSDNQIHISSTPARRGNAIRVEVRYDIPTILGSMFGLKTIPLRSTTVMMVLSPRR